MKLFIFVLFIIGSRAQPIAGDGDTRNTEKCLVEDLVLLTGQGGTGSEAVALFLDKSGVFQMTGRFGRCER